MRTLYLVRHGIAADAVGGMKDADRPLTREGVARMEAAARGWVAVGPIPATIVSSPLLRARQTALVLSETFRLEGAPLESDALAPGGSAEELLKFIARVAPKGDVACVGHMPDLVRLLGEMTGAGPGFSADLGKGTVATIEFAGGFRTGAGTLRAIVPNRILRRIR